MSNLVSDLLDFAQIKSGNFRKNIKSFNVREIVKNVICIQKRKAEQAKIDLRASFENISELPILNPEKMII